MSVLGRTALESSRANSFNLPIESLDSEVVSRSLKWGCLETQKICLNNNDGSHHPA